MTSRAARDMSTSEAQIHPPPELPQQTIFISDDDEDLEADDEWLNEEAHPHEEAVLYASHIQLQLRLCYYLLCALPVLLMLILLAWRRLGPHIVKQRQQDSRNANDARSDPKKKSR